MGSATQSPILTNEQQELHRWYWAERRALSQIAEWLGVSTRTAKILVRCVRERYAAVGVELPMFFNGALDRQMPPLHEIPVA